MFLLEIIFPNNFITPLSTWRMPDSASNNSVWPLPVTPANPKISPLRRLKAYIFNTHHIQVVLSH